MQVCSENANPNFTIFKLILGPIRKASCQSIIHLPISDISKHSPKNAYVTSCLRKEMHPSQIPVHSFIHSHESHLVPDHLQTFQRFPAGDCNLQSQEIWHLFGEHIWILKGLDLTPSEYAQGSLRKRAHKEDATVGGTGTDAAFMLQFLLKRELGPVPL